MDCIALKSKPYTSTDESHKYNVCQKSDRIDKTKWHTYEYVVKLYRKSRSVERERHYQGERYN